MELETRNQTKNAKCNKSTKKRRKLRKSCIIAIGVLVLGNVVWGGVEGYNLYHHPTIEGKWVSKETGSTVEFTKSGKVKVDRKEIGTYDIKTPDTMTYQIGDQAFDMYYKINQRDLIWKTAEEEDEIFDRKDKWIQLGLDIIS